MVRAALGLSWPVAWVLGAVVAPTDAAAVAAAWPSGCPGASLTTLRAESLINDGTALVVFALAVAVATGEEQSTWPSALGAASSPSYVGGAVAGLLAGLAGGRAGRRLMANDPLLEKALSVLTPFAAFLLAEEVHACGVLAVVVAAWRSPARAPRDRRPHPHAGPRVLAGDHVPAQRRPVRAGRAAAAPGGARSWRRYRRPVPRWRRCWSPLAVIGTRLVWAQHDALPDPRPGPAARSSGCAGWARGSGSPSAGPASAAGCRWPPRWPCRRPWRGAVPDRDLIVFVTSGSSW